MKRSNTFMALRATLTGGVLLSGLSILPAIAAEPGFQNMAPETFAKECTETTSFTQVCKPTQR